MSHRLVFDGSRELLASEPVGWAAKIVRSSAAGPMHVVVEFDGAVVPEGYRLAVGVDTAEGRSVTIAASEARGASYALTELAERLRALGLDGLVPGTTEQSAPAAPVRGICRAFSDVHGDLGWFRDRWFWRDYLDHLAMQRFNRFHLVLGFQYNFGFGGSGPQRATDNYLCFAYPFLIDVPGSGVRVQGLSDEERDRNFAALSFIADEVRRRGMSFHLGLWNHAHDYGNGSEHWFPILGISRQTHAAYTRAAVTQLLEVIPAIDGLTFRIHYEGGIADGHAAFWDEVFSGISGVARPIELGLHAKGVDDEIIGAASKPNLHPTLSAKFSAEHMGLPYHQASIRAFEAPAKPRPGFELMGTAEFRRRFTRYGYADFLREDRRVDVGFRLFPGTQRLLLWGDPAIASGYGRSATFAGATGLEICEPTFFKGRKGTGTSSGRDPYVDDDLRLGIDDWRKHAYTYVLWGRLLYDPDTEPETWRRHLRRDYGAAAADVETAMSSLSRVLPLVTSAHLPSASCNVYWPEMYTDLPISPWVHGTPYVHDTAPPANWTHASPLDPQLFYGIGEYARDALAGSLCGKYTPSEVATWLERLVDDAEPALDRAGNLADPNDAQWRRTEIDLRVVACLGRFFAAKFRAAVEYAFFEQAAERHYLERAIDLLDGAREHYARIPEIVGNTYHRDLTFGDRTTERGHWADRLPAITDDLRALRRELDNTEADADAARTAPVRRDERPTEPGCRLEAPSAFRPGEPLEVPLLVESGARITTAVLHHRPVDQSDHWRTAPMVPDGTRWVAHLSADDTATPFPLQLFAEIGCGGGHPVFVPGFGDDLSNQPYAVVRTDRAGP